MRLLLIVLALCASLDAVAGEFRSIGENVAPMYDAPSTRATKLYVASKYYPVEVIVQVDNWTKVRDAAGELSWVEKKNLSETRTVVVTAALADVRQRPEDGAATVFQARRGVALEIVELGAGNWAKVRHRDGQIGFVRANQVWGL